MTSKWQYLDRDLHAKDDRPGETLSCEKCARLFSDAAIMNSHIETVHKINLNKENKKPFSCKYCKKSFTRSNNRGKHEKTCQTQVQ